MKKLLSTLLAAALLATSAVSLTALATEEDAAPKIDLTALVGDADRINPANGATRMVGWDPESAVIAVSNSYEDQWVGGTGKGYLIDGQKGPADLATVGFFLSATSTCATANASAETPAWFTLNLGKVYAVEQFAFYPFYTAAESMNTGFPEDFTISVSEDGVSYTTVVTKTGYTAVAGQASHAFTFDKTKAQYIKFSCTKVASPILGVGTAAYDLALTEIEVYGAEPSEETEPTEPTESTEPTEPTEPTESTEPTEPTESTESTASSDAEKPTNNYVKIGKDGKLDLTAMLGGKSNNVDMPGWDAEGKFIKASNSLEVGWVNGYGKGFLIDSKVSSGSWPVDVGQFVALNNDGDTLKDVNSTSADINEWIEINLQSVFKLNKFGFAGLYNLADNSKYSGVPSDFTIQVSKDGKSWTTVVTKKGYVPTDGQIWNEFSFQETEAQYIRLNATKVTVQAGDNNTFGYTIALSEISVYGAAADSTDVPKTGTAAGTYMVILLVLATAAGACMILYKKRTI